MKEHIHSCGGWLICFTFIFYNLISDGLSRLLKGFVHRMHLNKNKTTIRNKKDFHWIACRENVNCEKITTINFSWRDALN